MNPFNDHAAPILRNDSALTDEHRENLWNVFHESKSPEELAQKLAPIPIADDTKAQLFQAKQDALAPTGPAKVQAAIAHMAGLDPATLDIAESHPRVLNALIAAMAQTETKAPTTDEPRGKALHQDLLDLGGAQVADEQ